MKVIPLKPRSTPARNVRRASDAELRAVAHGLRRPAEVSLDGRVVVQAKTELPTDYGTFDVRLFQFDGEPQEHLVLSVGDLATDEPVLVRMHSECFTGEVLHSQRCECGQQLAYAQKQIQRAGRGVIVYLRQEGRGIGLANKLRAYALQNLGADTVDANRLLGLPDDTRRYDAAAAVLRHLGIRSVRLITNNPAKSSGLEALGIVVADRVPVLVANNPIAANYLATKGERMAHEIPSHLELVPDVDVAE